MNNQNKILCNAGHSNENKLVGCNSKDIIARRKVQFKITLTNKRPNILTL